MTAHQQFNILWRVGCRKAILALVQNRGLPLSPKQIRAQIRAAVKNGMTKHVFALARMSESGITSELAEELLSRCLELGWVVDAICIPHEVPISGRAAKKLSRALIKGGHCGSADEVVELLKSKE